MNTVRDLASIKTEINAKRAELNALEDEMLNTNPDLTDPDLTTVYLCGMDRGKEIIRRALAARARVSPPGWKKRLMDACCQVRDAETDDSRNIAWHKFHKAMAGTVELPSPDLQSVVVVPKRKRSIRIKKPAVTLYYTTEEALAVAAGLIARVQELEGKEWA